MPGLMSAGSGKLVKIQLGDVNVFYGGTLNVKSKLPDMYDKLTVDNFFAEPLQSYLAWNYPDGRQDVYRTFSKSYSKQTGIITFSQMGVYHDNRLNGGLSTVRVYAVYVK